MKRMKAEWPGRGDPGLLELGCHWKQKEYRGRGFSERGGKTSAKGTRWEQLRRAQGPNRMMGTLEHGGGGGLSGKSWGPRGNQRSDCAGLYSKFDAKP